MKIFDSSAIIGILQDLDRSDLIDRILELGHDLAIPRYILETELRGQTRHRVEEMVWLGKIKILETRPLQELRSFGPMSPRVHMGERHVVLSYRSMVKDGHQAYCILDDGRARSYAKRVHIKHTGLLGLLRMLKDRRILKNHEIAEIEEALKRSDFRIPKGFVI